VLKCLTVFICSRPCCCFELFNHRSSRIHKLDQMHVTAYNNNSLSQCIDLQMEFCAYLQFSAYLNGSTSSRIRMAFSASQASWMQLAVSVSIVLVVRLIAQTPTLFTSNQTQSRGHVRRCWKFETGLLPTYSSDWSDETSEAKIAPFA
jgi:hypothetical protein